MSFFWLFYQFRYPVQLNELRRLVLLGQTSKYQTKVRFGRERRKRFKANEIDYLFCVNRMRYMQHAHMHGRTAFKCLFYFSLHAIFIEINITLTFLFHSTTTRIRKYPTNHQKTNAMCFAISQSYTSHLKFSKLIWRQMIQDSRFNNNFPYFISHRYIYEI